MPTRTTWRSVASSSHSAGTTWSPAGIICAGAQAAVQPSRGSAWSGCASSAARARSSRRKGMALSSARLVAHQATQAFDPVGLVRRLVPADAVDAREAHGEAGLVALAFVHRVECDLEHQATVGFAYRPEAVHRVIADVAVELLQFLVGKAEVRFAHGQQLGAGIGVAVPAAEGV